MSETCPTLITVMLRPWTETRGLGPATDVLTGFRGEDSQNEYGTHMNNDLRKRAVIKLKRIKITSKMHRSIK